MPEKLNWLGKWREERLVGGRWNEYTGRIRFSGELRVSVAVPCFALLGLHCSPACLPDMKDMMGYLVRRGMMCLSRQFSSFSTHPSLCYLYALGLFLRLSPDEESVAVAHNIIMYYIIIILTPLPLSVYYVLGEIRITARRISEINWPGGVDITCY